MSLAGAMRDAVPGAAPPSTPQGSEAGWLSRTGPGV